MRTVPRAYLAFEAIDRMCPETDCDASPGELCANVLSKTSMHMPHIKRQKPETT